MKELVVVALIPVIGVCFFVGLIALTAIILDAEEELRRNLIWSWSWAAFLYLLAHFIQSL